MIHLDFILWVVLMPLAKSITRHLNAKTNIIKNKDYVFGKQDNKLALIFGIIAVAIYVYIAYKLY